MGKKSLNQSILAISILFVFIASTVPFLSAAAMSNVASSNLHTSDQTDVRSSLYTGYQVKGPYSQIRIRGSWIVPRANCSQTPNSISNISVVIDGIDNEGDVMQVGTYANCVGGVAQYGPFANFAPFTHEKLPTLQIRPGDIVEVQGKWSTQTHGWHSQIIDETTGTRQAFDAGTPASFEPKLDSGAFLLSSNGRTLTSLSQISSGKQYTQVRNSDIVGPLRGIFTIGKEANMTGFTLVSYRMSGTTLSSLSSDGSSFTIS